MWKYAVLVLSLASLVLTSATQAERPAKKDKTPAVVEIKVKGVRLVKRGRPTKPTVINNAEELAKTIKDKKAQEQIKKQVNFRKQQVLVFAWAGSGRDKLSAKEGKVGVQFIYSPGRTRDLRPHLHVFAIRKGIKYQLTRGKPGF